MNLNKFLAGVALAAILASCSGKNEEKPTPKTPGTLTSLALLASDNSDLTEDIVISDITSSAPMIVRIEGGGKGKTLVATVTAGENDVITDGAGSVITNGKITFDASYALDIIVRNTESKLSTAYELKVGKILKTVVTKLASYSEENATIGTPHRYTMAINPADGLPYIAYTRKKTVAGVTDTYWTLSVVKWNSTSQKLELVGESGFPANATKDIAAPLFIGFDKNNTPEVIYGGGEVSGLFSAKKYTGGSWQDLGTPGFGEKYSTALITTEVYNNPVSGELGFFVRNDIKNDTYRRCHANIEFDGTTWLTTHAVLPGLNDGSSNAFYCANGFNTASAAYVITSTNGLGYSVYKNVNGNSWSAVVDNFVPEDGSSSVVDPILRSDKDGNVYAFVPLYKSSKMQLYKVDEANSKFVPYGGALSAVYSSGGGNQEYPTMAINPVTNEFFAAKVVDQDLHQVQWSILDPETKQWSEFKTIVDNGDVADQVLRLAYDATGVGYLVYYLKDKEDKTKITIELCKIATEDDILPE